MFLISTRLDASTVFQLEWNRREYERVMFERMMQQNFPEKKLRPCPYKRSRR